MHRPDPTLTASIYRTRPLNGLVRGAIVPFRDELRRHDPEGRWTLWMVRYTKCGAHLKLRLHGPEHDAALVRRLLSEALERHFADIEPEAPAGERRRARPKAQPVDLEDEQAEDYADRTVLWTHYRRSGVTLGPNLKLVDDDGYASRFTAAMATAAELVLDAFRAGQPDGAHLKTLLFALAAGVTAVPFDAEQRAGYAAYHRDWLLRFMVSDLEQDRDLRARFDARLPGMQGLLEQTARTAAAWDDGTADATASEARWREALAELFGYVAAGFRGDPECQSDPFSDDPVYPSLFKVLHGLANQFGIDMLNEALVHHLLFHALAGEGAGVAAAAR